MGCGGFAVTISIGRDPLPAAGFVFGTNTLRSVFSAGFPAR
jgi:hypothetical protein